VLALALFGASASIPWHPDAAVRRATGIVRATLTLWVREVAPLGVVALMILVAAGIPPARAIWLVARAARKGFCATGFDAAERHRLRHAALSRCG
jgi:hypothetical protein